MRRTVTIDEANAGRRLDSFVRRLLSGASLSTVMKWIRTGVVRVNGKKQKAAYRLVLGDGVEVPEMDEAPAPKRPRLPKPDIVYEDEDLLIVNKPPGLAVHPGTAHDKDSLTARIEGYLSAHAAGPGRKPGLAQRLDRGASGLIPVGKHAPALRALAQAVESGAADKLYLALVDGVIRADKGEITLPLRIDDQPMGNRPRVFPDPAGLPAHTLYEVRERLRGATLVAVRIRTGRTHQIRAHLRALGHPILGDPRYGDAERNEQLRATFGLDRPLLHAAELTVPHPKDGRPQHFTAPLPEDFARVLRGEQQRRAPRRS